MTPESFRAIRRHLGFTQAGVARLMGVTRSALCQWEKTGQGLAEWRVLRATDKLLATWKIWSEAEQ